MCRNFIVGLWVLMCLTAGHAATAQSPWTSTDVGSVGIAGSAGGSNGSWEVIGSGANIWGTADAFQFVHVPIGQGGRLMACVRDLQNTDPFAKAGIMLRASLDPGAATAILDVKPDGGVEFMIRPNDGAAMEFIAGTTSTFPVCLQLSWQGSNIHAATSSTAATWTPLADASVSLPPIREAGLAVTSRDNTQRAIAHFDEAIVTKIAPDDWYTSDVGDVGVAGSTEKHGGTWTVTGAGGNIWADRDAFRYVYRVTPNNDFHLVVRVDDLKAASTFAKAGIMLRNGLDAGAAAVVLDVRPGGDIEFMSRQQQNDSMEFLGTAHVTFPVWLQLDWQFATQTTKTVVASYSQDHEHWQTVGAPLTWAVKDFFLTGVAVTSQDVTQTATADFEGLSLLLHGVWGDDVGDTGIIGNAAVDLIDGIDLLTTVEGAGSNIWGTTDSFYFVHRDAEPATSGGAVHQNVVRLSAHSPYAKAGVMYRDGLAADAPTVILDVKPDGDLEFMARRCNGCPMEFIATAHVTLPAVLELSRDRDGTFTASTKPNAAVPVLTVIGTVSVAMVTPIAGTATTSQDPSMLATASYDYPAY